MTIDSIRGALRELQRDGKEPAYVKMTLAQFNALKRESEMYRLAESKGPDTIYGLPIVIAGRRDPYFDSGKVCLDLTRLP